MRKKEKLDAKYPGLQAAFGENEQIVRLDDARFQEVFEGGDEYNGEGAVGAEQRKRRDVK